MTRRSRIGRAQGLPLIMVGPDFQGRGGISRVVSLWKSGGYFGEFGVAYLATVSEGAGKLSTLLQALWRFLLACLGGCRGVYVHTASQNSFYRKSLFMMLALLLGRRLIVHIHPANFCNFLSALGPVRKRLACALLSKAELLVVLTPEIKESLARLLPGRPIQVLNNPIDVGAMKNGSGIERRAGQILYLGWYMKRKGVYELVDALEMLLAEGHQVTADFYGTKEVEALTRYVSDRGLQEKVKINGWIGEEEKLAALYRCNLLALPSHTEGIPNVILEAMATHTPIVSTLVGGLKDILRDGANAVCVEPENAQDLKRGLLEVLQDPRLATDLAAAAFREASAKYDLPVIKREFQTILQRAGM